MHDLAFPTSESPKKPKEQPPRPVISYTDYNYGPGLVGWIKRQHFRAALEFITGLPRLHVAMDWGCADGPFLDDLLQWFPLVYGVEPRPDFRSSIEPRLGLVVLPTAGVIRGVLFDRIFALEVFEHIPPIRWRRYLRDLDDLLFGTGKLILSVPIMIGPTFWLQRFGLWATGRQKEELTWRLLLCLGVGIVDPGLWAGGHVGFDHRRLEREIKASGLVFNRKRLMFQYLYEIHR